MRMAKLTLSVPQDLLYEAKKYSQQARRPLSRLVSQYFSLLSKSLSKKKESPDLISTKVRQLTGIVKSNRSEEELLFEALHHKYR